MCYACWLAVIACGTLHSAPMTICNVVISEFQHEDPKLEASQLAKVMTRCRPTAWYHNTGERINKA